MASIFVFPNSNVTCGQVRNYLSSTLIVFRYKILYYLNEIQRSNIMGYFLKIEVVGLKCVTGAQRTDFLQKQKITILLFNITIYLFSLITFD